ncbi:MAG: serine/threonine-protein kinase, partial [Bacteroidota bacterium]
MIGQRIGSYDVVRFIGEGGMGTVFQGVDAMLDREVAIKALRPELASQENVAARFRSEAVTLARLNHPNVALLYSFLQEPNGHLYMVMEFVRGETLEDLLRRVGPLEPAQAVEVMAQILDGVGHAHEAGIIHRDLKPANAMLTETGRVKVMDFGIARALGSARMTRAGRLIGTLEYMAPEQVQGKEATPATDVYALGIVLYELLTGRVPFESQSDFTLMQAQIQEAPAPPRVFRPGMPDALEAVILKALEKDPAARFASADEFRDALLALDLPAAKPIVGHVGVLDATQPNQYKTAAGLAPTVVAGGAVGGATRVASPSETPQTAVSAAAGGSLMHTLKTSRPAQIVLATALGVVMILGLFFAISGGGTTEPSSRDDLADQPGLSEEPPAERTNPSESPDLVQRTAPAGTLNQPDSGPAFVTVADLVQEARGHAAAGRADAARAVVKRILSVDPDNTEALQIQRQLDGEPETASRETTTRPAQRRTQPERRRSSGTE